MRVKKVAILIILTLFVILVTGIGNEVEAATASQTKYLKIMMLRESGFGYQALNKAVWEIVETNSSGTTEDHSATIYCIKGGPGFGSTEFGNGSAIERPYTQYFDLKDLDSISPTYRSALPSGDDYVSLVWLLEHVYIAPANSSENAQAEEYRDQLLDAAGVNNGYLTDDDIDVVQQLAVWHFTNNDAYDAGDSLPELYINSVKGTNGNYHALTDEDGEGGEYGWDRQYDAEDLYDYLITEAERAASSGYEPQPASQPYELANTNITIEEQGSNYVIGPFRINQISDTTATLEGTFKNGSQTIHPTLQNASGGRFNNLQETVGQNFYIVLPQSTTLDTISLEISGSYYETTVEYWSVANAPSDDQPVVIVKREPVTYRDDVSFTPSTPEPEEFDLALRKFITSINNDAPSTSRVPQISDDTLNDLRNGTITTAEKIHPKNALLVETGDSVVYTIRVYNEGNVDGIVTEITDYLPEGLTLTEDSSINAEYGWTTNGDGRTVTTDYLNGTVLDAFDGTTLDYADVQIECTVTASTQENNVNLKNVAEITGATDSEGTPQDDIDSTPDNVNVPGYGEESQEDDDDFENLTLVGKYFDLALRKFITSIEGTTVTPSRVPQISQDAINDFNNDPNITTVEKVHPKNALAVETGDSVIYTIRVYNEGEIDGIVTEITDYLPEGLTLTADSSINTQYGWTASGDGRTVTTNYLNGTVLDAFNGTTFDYADVQIECTVTASTQENNVNLKNVAEITGATDSEGNPQDDIDSTPDNVDVPSYGNESQEDDDDFEDLVILGRYFDLSLRKFIIQVNDTELKDEEGNYLREPVVDVTPLTNGSSTTAIYNHPKTPVQAGVGDEIIYTLRVYNEGQLDGYVYEITDYLPENLEFVNDAFNAQYGWQYDSNSRVIYTDITSPDTTLSANRDIIYADRTEGSDKVLLQAFDGTTLDYIDVKIKVRIKETAQPDEKLTNIAEVTDARDENKQDVIDRDSAEDDVTIPNDETLPNYKDDEINSGNEYIPGQEDDDDFEKVIIQKFDLALRKFITAVNDQTITDREPVFHNNNGEYTYEHTKEPVLVATGDTVIYTLRIYNEGDIAGYAEEVKDDLPDGLEFLPDNTTNINYRWVMYNANGEVTENVEEAVSIRTDYLSKAQEEATGRDNLIDAFDPETMDEPDYKEVRIAFRVTLPNTSNSIVTNIAEISEDANEEGEPVDDIDSTPDNDEEEEDDIDEEHVKVTYFDLALRKFITGVNEEPITNRVPIFSIENGEYVYTHTKEPVEVANGDTVIYTLRIYNEGTQAGYAEEVKDDLPEGLEFLPENSINTEYRWVMYDANGEVTENVAEAVSIRTDYLSKAQADATGRDNLIEGFDPETMTQPDYKDLQIAFRVTEPNTSDRILINTAEVSEDADEDGEPVDDIDSTPDNDEEEEDDIDIEKVKVTYFDLALKKIISKLTMELDGKTYVEQTGHTFEDDPEEIVKIELGSNQIERATFKFTYQIRITNEGNKAGYAYEIKDYIPEGLEFVAEDNEGWIINEDGTVTTDQLSDVLLEPGESATIEITLRWINKSDNLGVKTNWAEISEDSDDDIDSTPDNEVQGEDDIDDASVVLSIVTGVGGHNIAVIAGVLVLLGTGVILIKKFVL